MAVTTSPRTVTATRSPGATGGAPRTARGLLQHALDTPLASVYLVIASAGLLLGLGVLMVLSSSSVLAEVTKSNPYYYVQRQLLFVAVGLVGAWVVARLSPRTLRFLAWPALLVAAVFLMLTFVPGLGISVDGNRNWIRFGTPLLQFQPSEFAKAAICLWGADNLARKEKILDRPRELVPYLLFTTILIGLVVLQRDMGTAVIMSAMVVAVLFLCGAPLRLLAAMFTIVAAGAVVLVFTSANRMNRILGFLNPGNDIEGVNQQPLRGIYALASGGWWGLGLGQSKQKWGMLVAAHTDYVFAIIGEELGLVGSTAVIGLFALFGYAALRIARRSDDAFCRNLSVGIGAWFVIQAIGNIAVVLRVVPGMGVTLPLVSYGGSSLLATTVALGLLLACARHEPAARRVLAKRTRTPRARVTAVVDRRSVT